MSILAILLAMSLGPELGFAQSDLLSEEGNILLTRAEGVCTSEHYVLTTKSYSQSQSDWLRMILNFVHTPEKVHDSSYEEISPTRVSEEELQRLLASSNFLKWANKSLLDSIHLFINARKAYVNFANNGRATHRLSTASPQFKEYLRSRARLLGVLRGDFHVQKIQDEVCDRE